MSERFATRFFEINSKSARGGKRPIKLILHEIMDSTEKYQNNGVSWNEQYVREAMETLKQAPIAVEYITKGLDADDTEISGHGYVCDTEDTDGNKMPLYNENSEIVGSITDGEITAMMLNGKETKVLVANGVLYEHRCKGLVAWLKKNVPLGNVMGSVEIVGLPENGGKIVYDGGWKETGRVPMKYAYSGHVILSADVAPADESCYVLEVNQKKEEDRDMDNAAIREMVDEIKNEIHTVFDKSSDHENELNSRNESIAEKDKLISELNSQIDVYKAALEQVNAEMETCRKQMEENEKKWNDLWNEHDVLGKELAEMKAAERLRELENALAGFTEEEKAYAAEQINAFKEDPMGHEVCSVTDVIYREIGKSRKVIEDEKAAAGEQNEKAAAEDDDIFAEVFANESHIAGNSGDDDIF